MNKMDLFLMTLGLFVVAYVPRVLPLLYFTKRKVPTWFSEWMKYVPVALFAALSFKDVFITHGDFDLFWNVKILAMLLVVVVTFKTRSMALSVITGLAAIFLLNLL